MTDTRPITAWSSDGKAVVTFPPSPKIKLRQRGMFYKPRPRGISYIAPLKSLAPAIQRMRMLGHTFEHIAQELGISRTAVWNNIRNKP